MKRFYLLAIVIFLMAGCARVAIVKTNPKKENEEGLRFYRPHPYLWITRDKDNVLQGTIVWLPDKNEDYRINVTGWIGKIVLKCTLENGWNLTEFGETMDSKTTEFITALTGTFKRLTAEEKAKQMFPPGLYMLIFDKDSGLIESFKPVVLSKH